MKLNYNLKFFHLGTFECDVILKVLLDLEAHFIQWHHFNIKFKLRRNYYSYASRKFEHFLNFFDVLNSIIRSMVKNYVNNLISQ